MGKKAAITPPSTQTPLKGYSYKKEKFCWHIILLLITLIRTHSNESNLLMYICAWNIQPYLGILSLALMAILFYASHNTASLMYQYLAEELVARFFWKTKQPNIINYASHPQISCFLSVWASGEIRAFLMKHMHVGYNKKMFCGLHTDKRSEQHRKNWNKVENTQMHLRIKSTVILFFSVKKDTVVFRIKITCMLAASEISKYQNCCL